MFLFQYFYIVWFQEIPDSRLYIGLRNNCVWFGWIHHNKIKGDSGSFIVCVNVLWPVSNKNVHVTMKKIQSHNYSDMCN